MRVLWAMVVALAVLPSGAAVADEIPRPPGAIDRRGYELVSLPDKDTSQIRSVSVSPTGGDRVRYDLFGGAPGSPAGFSAMFLASRTASGWTSKSYLPPRAEMLRSNYMVDALTPDLSHAIVAIVDSLGGNGDSRDVTLARLDEDGHQSLIHTFPVVFAPFGTWAVASDDLRHVLTATPEAIDASHQPGTYDVYDFGGASPTLVSAMPGTGLAPQCGVPVPGGEGFATELDTVAQHWVLPDGSRAFFITQGDDCGGPASCTCATCRPVRPASSRGRRSAPTPTTASTSSCRRRRTARRSSTAPRRASIRPTTSTATPTTWTSTAGRPAALRTCA